MKKDLAVIAGVLACLTQTPASAQTGPTLYGLIDLGLAHIDNVGGASSMQVRSGNTFTSRFGFRGSEDLGGGLKASFNLEAGLNADTGTNSTPFFNRQSWVGLSSSTFGDISVGRMLPIISDLTITSLCAVYLGNPTAAIDGMGVGPGSSAARFNNMVGGTRVDNTIKYRSPTFAGFTLLAMTSLGETPGSGSAGRILSGGAGYSSEHIEAGLVYHEKECNKATGCGIAEGKDRIVALVGAYKHHGARYSAIYTRQKNALNVRGNDADVIDILVRVPVNQWVFATGVQYQNDRTTLNQDTRQVNFGINYLLSKRTMFYTLYSHQWVANGGKAGMYAVTSDDSRQNQFSTGILHHF